jgi:hypothetical protein
MSKNLTIVNNILQLPEVDGERRKVLIEVEKVVKVIEMTATESKNVVVLTTDHCDEAGFYLKKFKDFKKRLDPIRKQLVEPLRTEEKTINNYFKKVYSIYEDEETRLTDELNLFLLKKREIEEAERLKEQKEMEDDIIEEAVLFNDERILENIPEVQSNYAKISQETTNLKSIRKKVWKLIDIDKVPRKYLTINEELINQIRATYDFQVTEQPIEGIEFGYDEKVGVR